MIWQMFIAAAVSAAPILISQCCLCTAFLTPSQPVFVTATPASAFVLKKTICHGHQSRQVRHGIFSAKANALRVHANDKIGFVNQGEHSSKEHHDETNDGPKYSHLSSISSRRSVLQSIATISAVTAISIPVSATGATAATGEVNAAKLDCLLDLPPLPSDCVRLYLCRHGQTEYNRLKQIQGARVDAPLNGTGMRQAARLGAALSYLDNGNGLGVSDGISSGIPHVVLKAGAHSNMLRARQTASIAAATLDSIGAEKRNFALANSADGVFVGGDLRERKSFDVLDDDKYLQFVSETAASATSVDISNRDGNDNTNNNIDNNCYNALKLQPLSSLGEVDFGPLNEGKPSTLARADMYATYGAWAIGNIDASLGEGGETGRQVLSRATSALNTLVDIAASNGGSAVAFSHSTYLRMLLGLVMEVPLTEAAAIEQKNCCINVLDVSTVERRDIGPNSNLFGRMAAPQDFRLNVPNASVVRVNENQHLAGLL